MFTLYYIIDGHVINQKFAVKELTERGDAVTVHTAPHPRLTTGGGPVPHVAETVTEIVANLHKKIHESSRFNDSGAHLSSHYKNTQKNCLL